MRAAAIGFSALFTCLAASFAMAANYHEAVDGDLSSVAVSPTAWNLTAGANTITGSAGTNHAAGTVDYDLLAFTVPAGHQLDSITILSYSNESEFGASFFGLQADSPWYDGFGWNIGGYWLMGYAHVQASNVGTDLLPRIHENAPPPEFTIPLASGVYTMLIEDIDTPFNYSLQFNVSAASVPEPSSLAIGCVACAGLAAFRRRYAA
jgi:hypothetical protein